MPFYGNTMASGYQGLSLILRSMLKHWEKINVTAVFYLERSFIPYIGAIYAMKCLLSEDKSFQYYLFLIRIWSHFFEKCYIK